MEEIPIAYPILDESNDYSITNIMYNVDYDFKIKYQINNYIEITLNKSYIIYQQLITKSNMRLDRLYKLIINGLNNEPNYLIDIQLDNDDIKLVITYNSDIIDINEEIILIKQSNAKTTELLLVDKIKELDNKLSICFMHIHKKINIDDNYYDINTEVLDLSNVDSYFGSKCDFDTTMHRFTNINTLTINNVNSRYLLTPIKNINDYRNNIETITITTSKNSSNFHIVDLLNYCCSLQSIKKHTIIIKNLEIHFRYLNQRFFLIYEKVDTVFDKLSKSKLNFQIIFENVLFLNFDSSNPDKRTHVNYSEFITLSGLDKYNIFQNI